MSRIGSWSGTALLAAVAIVVLNGPAVAIGGAAGVPAKIETNKAFAGYEVAKTKTHIHSAALKFVIPRITCRNSLSGVGPSVLIQSTPNQRTDASSESGGGVGVACENKTPIYNAIVEVVNHSYDDNLHPLKAGDRVVVTVAYGKRKTTATVRDVTARHSFTRSARHSVGEYAFFGDSSVEIDQKGIGLDPFATTHFRGARVNGRWITVQKPIRTNWVNNKGAVLVAARKLTKSDTFTTTFERSR
jgi:hypothetical protein